MLNTVKMKLKLNGTTMELLTLQLIVLIVILKRIQVKLQLFGLEMILLTLRKFLIKNYIKMFVKQLMDLKSLGIQKGDRVTIYLTMIPELAYVMLACARIGAVHSIIFGGFSPDSIATRINDCESDYLITADEGVRGGKIIPLKKISG